MVIVICRIRTFELIFLLPIVLMQGYLITILLTFIYSNLAQECIPFSYYNTTLDSCRMCSLDHPGCAICQHPTQCHGCYSGYYLNSDTCQLCASVLDSCVSCTDQNHCTICSPQTYLNGAHKCVSCSSSVPGCQQCDDDGKCLKCQTDKYNVTDSTCASCSQSIQNCLKCGFIGIDNNGVQTNTLYCFECLKGYYANSLGGCSRCDSGCLACGDDGECLQCTIGSYSDTNGICQNCPSFCLHCNATQYCQNCALGYFIDNGICSPCTHPCATCELGSSTCVECVMGYYHDGSSCVKCNGCAICHPTNGSCLSCFAGSYLPLLGNTCLSCLNDTSNCLICDGSTCLYCGSGYKLVSGSCVAIYPSTTVPNCMLMIQSSGQCEFCIPGYYLDNNICELCPVNCLTCENGSYCTSCLPGLFLDSNVCRICEPPCITCTSQTECLSCDQSTFLNDTSCSSCNKAIPNCVICGNENECLRCQPNFYGANCDNCQIGQFFDGGTCLQCESDCIQCTSETNCINCGQKFYLQSGSCLSCINKDPQCILCSPSECLQCKIGYALSDGTCDPCSLTLPNCQYCSTNQSCVTCQFGYFLSDGDCFSCQSITHCLTCSKQAVCQLCENLFYSDSNGVCQPCPTECELCDGNTCHKCQTGYFLNETSDCQSCNQRYPMCKQCQLGECSVCESSFYLSAVTTCSACSDNLPGCLYCNQDSTLCYACEIGYSFVSPGCVKCSISVGCAFCNDSGCIECESGFYLREATSDCAVCEDGCVECIENQCLRCDSGYYRSGIQCLLCQSRDDGCALCEQDDCRLCQSGFFLNGTQCDQCLIVGCQVCDQLGECITCNQHYYLQQGVCVDCGNLSVGCEKCITGGDCSSCVSGYYLNSDTCEPCFIAFPGCNHCSISQCLECHSGYYLDAPDCVACRQDLFHCLQCQDSLHCKLCDTNSYLDMVTNTCQPCSQIANCLICDDNETCTECISGFYIQSNLCNACDSAIEGCHSCSNDSICLVCQGSYRLKNGACQPLQGVTKQLHHTLSLFTQYISSSILKHTLQVDGSKFVRIEQIWRQVVEILIITNQGQQIYLTIQYVEWSSSNPIRQIHFYTNNIFGNLAQNSDFHKMPLFRRLLTEIDPINCRIQFLVRKQAINQFYPSLVADRDVTMEYRLDQPHFYRSLIKQKKQYFFVFGYFVSLFLVAHYLFKITLSVPQTNDQGQIIPHILLMKVPAIVYYPSLSGYLSYCAGFTLLDFPWANGYFSQKLTDPADISPEGFVLFYSNTNFASTYLLAFIIFSVLCALLLAIKVLTDPKSQHTETEKDQKKTTITQFLKYICHIFICGLVFSGFACIIGILYNQHNFLSVGSIFYILGIAIYAVFMFWAVFDLRKQQPQFQKVRVFAKTTLFGMMVWSPIGMFTAAAIVDLALIYTQYSKEKANVECRKQWVVNQVICVIAYSSIILFPNTVVGLVFSSVLIVVVLVMDVYIHYRERKMMITPKVGNEPDENKQRKNLESLESLNDEQIAYLGYDKDETISKIDGSGIMINDNK